MIGNQSWKSNSVGVWNQPSMHVCVNLKWCNMPIIPATCHPHGHMVHSHPSPLVQNGSGQASLAVVPMSGINLDWGISGLVGAAIQVGSVSGESLIWEITESLATCQTATGDWWDHVFGLPWGLMHWMYGYLRNMWLGVELWKKLSRKIIFRNDNRYFTCTR